MLLRTAARQDLDQLQRDVGLYLEEWVEDLNRQVTRLER